MTALVCPDKFRGSLSAAAAADSMERGLRRAGIDDVRTLPLADGGEGTLDALLARGGSRRRTTVTDPLGRPIEAEWGVLPGGAAVVEAARASGLALVGAENDPLRASTRGTGELVATAITRGAEGIIVAVGGSATTDGGLGAVTALDWTLSGLDVVVACDVRTRFLDAARVFGPQKGATPAQVELLTRRLERVAGEYRSRMGVDVTTIDGSGAAGGLAGGLAAIGARLESGFDVVADALGLGELLDEAQLVVTGEGRLDASSLHGKVVGEVLEWAADAGVGRRAVICGRTDPATAEEVAVAHGAPPVALVERAWDEGDAIERAPVLCEEAAVEVGRSFLAGR